MLKLSYSCFLFVVRNVGQLVIPGIDQSHIYNILVETADGVTM